MKKCDSRRFVYMHLTRGKPTTGHNVGSCHISVHRNPAQMARLECAILERFWNRFLWIRIM